jgi:hypothetical protein
MCPACGNRRVTVVLESAEQCANSEEPAFFGRAHLDVNNSISLIGRYLCANDFESEIICQPIIGWQLNVILFTSHIKSNAHTRTPGWLRSDCRSMGVSRSLFLPLWEEGESGSAAVLGVCAIGLVVAAHHTTRWLLCHR